MDLAIRQLVRRSFTAGQAARIAGVDYHHLNHWCRIGLVEPTVRKASGSDSLRVYGFADVVALKVVAVLRQAGFECEPLRAVAEFLQQRSYTLQADRLLICTKKGEIQETTAARLPNILGQSFVWVLNLAEVVHHVAESANNMRRPSRGRACTVA